VRVDFSPKRLRRPNSTITVPESKYECFEKKPKIAKKCKMASDGLRRLNSVV